jgi:malonate-semialdehyde dehydrogenase (acetylating)/methylmalonate-semialdehyde dehydrogenase
MGRDGFIFFTESKNVTSTWFTGKATPAKVSTWDGTMNRD